MPDRFQVVFGEPAKAADPEFYALVRSLEVEESADLPGALQLSLRITTEGAPGFEDLTLVSDERWKPYARLAVLVTPEAGTSSCIFDGYVLSHKLHVDRGTTASTLRVWGQDASCLMNVKEQVKVWIDKSDAEIAKAIFDTYSFEAAGANDVPALPKHTESGHPLVQRTTDAQFLRDRARRNGRLFRVCCDQEAGRNTGYFIKPDLRAAPHAKLILNRPGIANVEALDIEWDVARPGRVLSQILLAKKDPHKVDTQASGLDPLDARSLAAFIDDEKHVMQAQLTSTADSAEELKQRAASLLSEAGWFVRCEGECDLTRLNKVLRAARVVEIAGAGKVHSGNYFVWSVRHTITAESHRMRFVLVRNAVGSA